MTNREAPFTLFGNGLPPSGSAVVAKSRFRLYSARPIDHQLSFGSGGFHGFPNKQHCQAGRLRRKRKATAPSGPRWQILWSIELATTRTTRCRFFFFLVLR